jgi:hypothetical protein
MRRGAMRRRELMSLVGAVVPCSLCRPFAARAQEPAKLPTIGFLGSGTPAADSP